MKREFAITKNVARLNYAVHTLMNSPHGIERMGLLYGFSGEGKTTTVDYLIDQTDGISLRAMRGWTPTWMLSTLCAELRLSEKIRHSNRKQIMHEAIVAQLSERPRPIFIDEIDHLFAAHNSRNGSDILECLRDIYDTVKAPVLLVGEENSAVAIQDSCRFARRITQWVEFRGIDRADARILADTVGEVRISDDLLDYLYDEAGANVGRMVLPPTKDGPTRHRKVNPLDRCRSMTATDVLNPPP